MTHLRYAILITMLAAQGIMLNAMQVSGYSEVGSMTLARRAAYTQWFNEHRALLVAGMKDLENTGSSFLKSMTLPFVVLVAKTKSAKSPSIHKCNAKCPFAPCDKSFQPLYEYMVKRVSELMGMDVESLFHYVESQIIAELRETSDIGDRLQKALMNIILGQNLDEFSEELKSKANSGLLAASLERFFDEDELEVLKLFNQIPAKKPICVKTVKICKEPCSCSKSKKDFRCPGRVESKESDK
jgi:hypothetical protein